MLDMFSAARLVIRPLAFFEGRRLSLINLFQLMSTFLLYVEQKMLPLL